MPPEHAHRLRLFLLGGFELRHGTRVLIDDAWPHGPARALLKLLALQPGGAMSRDAVSAIFWPNDSPKDAAAKLYKALHFARKAVEEAGVGDPFVLQRTTVGLNHRLLVIDIDTFRRECAVALASGGAEALERALAPYGDLLPNDRAEPWMQTARRELGALRRDVLMALGGALEAAGDLKLAAARYEEVVLADAAREDAHAALMRVYAASGQRDRALRQYETCRQALRTAFGASPSAELQRLHEALRSGAAVAAPSAARARVATAPAGVPGFIGREGELADLRAALLDAAGGSGRVRLIAGEPGIGKTRLAEELAAAATSEGALVLWGRCFEGDGAPAYWPWLQVLRAYAAACPRAELRAALGIGAGTIAQVSPEIRAEVPDAVEPPPLEPEQARFRLFDAVAGLLQRAGAERPLVLMLEDLHGADQPSLQLLRFAVRELRTARVLVVGTYRDEEVRGGHALQPILAALARERGYGRIALGRFAEQEVRAFVRAGAGVEPADGLVAELYRRTDGNPLYLREMLRLYLNDPSAKLDERQARELPVPASVRDVIGQRLALLSPECRGVLDVAAVIGREFALEQLAQALEPGRAGLLTSLQEAIDARVVSIPGQRDGRYLFTHALIRDTLYEALGVEARVALHGRIGTALERTHGGDPSRATSELAYHFFEAAAGGGDTGKAVRYATLAARYAESILAYEEAVHEYERALRALDLRPGADERLRCELLLALAEAAKAAGDPAQAREACMRAAGIARALRDAEWLGRAALCFEGAGVTTGSADRTLVALLREALDAGEAADSSMRSRLLGRLAMAVYWGDSPEVREQLSQQSLSMARRLGDPSALAYALKARHFSLGTERLEERLGISTEIVRMAQQAGDREMEFGGHGTHLMDFLEMGDIAGVDGELRALTRLADELRQPLHLWARTVRQSMRATLAGQFAEGERLAREAVAAGMRSRDPNVLPYFGLQMVSVCGETGRMDELGAPLSQFIEQYPAVLAWRTARALMFAQTGREDEARAEFEIIAERDFAGLARDWTWLGAVTLCCRVAAYLGDAKRAGVLHDLLAPYAGRTVVVAAGVSCWGAVSRYLGVCGVLLEHWDDAERAFEAALEMNARMQAAPYLAHTQQEYAWMLLERGRREDRDRARGLLAEATEVAERLAMPSLAGWCAQIRAREGWPEVAFGGA